MIREKAEEFLKQNHGGLRAGAGRKPTPDHLRRVVLTDRRIPQWPPDWLKTQPESLGRVIEVALIEKHGLTQPD